MKKLISSIILFSFTIQATGIDLSTMNYELSTKYTLRPASAGIRSSSSGSKELQHSLAENSDEGLQNIIAHLDLYAHNKISQSQFILEANLFIMLDTYNRVVFSSRSRKYIIKIYKDKNNHGYATEKDFYLNINPAPRPAIFYYNDDISALIIENLNYARLFDQFGFMHSPTTTIEQIENSVRSAARNIAVIHQNGDEDSNIQRKPEESYHDLLLSQMNSCLKRLKDTGFDESVDMSFFSKYRELAMSEKFVHTHGDYIPWNIFVDPVSGEVEGLIDAEYGRLDSRVKEIANVILGLIDARKNRPLLIENTARIISVFLDEYLKESGLERDTLLALLPYYLVSRLIIGAEICYSKWHNRDWARWRLMLAEKISTLNSFSIESMVDSMYCDIDKHKVLWAGWIDVLPDIGPVSGKTITINRNDSIDVYVRVKIEGAANNPLLATNISACIWTNANRRAWDSVYPLEFMNVEGDTYLFMGKLKARTSVRSKFTARFSTDNGKTWVTAKTDYGMPVLEVKKPIIAVDSQPMAVIIGDVHAELLGLRESLYASGLVHKAARHSEDMPIAENVIFGQVGDILDRGPYPYETYSYLKGILDRFRRFGGDGFILLGNHELDYLRGKLSPPDRATRRALESIREDVLSGNIRAAYSLHGRLVIHGGQLPHILADIAKKLKPHFIKQLARSLNKPEADLTDEEIALARNENPELLTMDEIADELNIRLVEAVGNNDFSDIIFDEGNSHFKPYKIGVPGYIPSGIFWADFDDELMLTDETLLVPQIVGHKEGRSIRWSPQGKIININIINLYGRGRNSGILILGEDGIWRAVYSDGRPTQKVPEDFSLTEPFKLLNKKSLIAIEQAA